MARAASRASRTERGRVGVADVLDKAGPGLATAIVMAILAGATTVTVGVHRHIAASDVWRSDFASQLAQLRSDLDGFRNPGARFTAADGERHWQRLDELDRRLRAEEVKPPRLTPAIDGLANKVGDLERGIDRLEERMATLREEQQRLCDRLQACKGAAR